MTTNNNDTFVKITNKDIYAKLCDIEVHVLATNGKVKLNKWIASTALTVGLLAVGWCLATI